MVFPFSFYNFVEILVSGGGVNLLVEKFCRDPRFWEVVVLPFSFYKFFEILVSCGGGGYPSCFTINSVEMLVSGGCGFRVVLCTILVVMFTYPGGHPRFGLGHVPIFTR